MSYNQCNYYQRSQYFGMRQSSSHSKGKLCISLQILLLAAFTVILVSVPAQSADGLRQSVYPQNSTLQRSHALYPSKSLPLHHIQRRSVRKSANTGSSVTLDCDINYPDGGYTEHIIKWHKQGIEVPIYIQLDRLPSHVDSRYQGRVRVVDRASIEINQLRESDEGWYECSVVFIQKSDDINPNGTWVYLAVTAPPDIKTKSPSLLIKKAGSDVEMVCEATGIPRPVMTWMREGKELESQGRLTVNPNRLRIVDLTEADAGEYSCLFKNTVAQISHTMRLVIKRDDWVYSENAYIMVPPKNSTDLEGTRVKLTCKAEAFPGNITYHWSREGVDVHLLTGLMTRAGIFADGSLIISSVRAEDTGWYKCQPSNGLGQAPNAQAFLNVTYLPRVSGSMPSTVYLPLGMTGRLECPTEANPPVSHFTWSKNGQLLSALTPQATDPKGSATQGRYYGPTDSAYHQHLKVNRQGSLLMKPVQPTDGGQYSCTPYSDLGPGQPSPLIHVLVRDPPRFTERPRPIYQQYPSQSVTMPCSAEADPQPSISWRKVDGSFPARSRIMQSGGNLTILRLAKEDQGIYECIASNIVTNVITTTLLIVEFPLPDHNSSLVIGKSEAALVSTPHAPYNVSVRPTQNTATVTWLPAYDKGHSLHYVLWYKLMHVPKEEWITLRVVPNNATSLTVYSLQPNSEYQFMVLSRNRLGQEQFSPPVTATTRPKEAVPGVDEEEYYEEFPNGPTDYEPNYSGEYEEEEKPDYGDPKPQTSENLYRPNAPLNVTVKQLKNQLQISWLAPRESLVPIISYDLEYKTVAQWVKLTNVNKTHHIWTTASHGAIYRFRVFSVGEDGVKSDSSPEAMISTKDPVVQPVVPENMIGATVGGIVFLFMALLILIVSLWVYHSKRRQRPARYGDVKYFGPNQVELTAHNSRTLDGLPCNSTLTELEPLPIIENHIVPHNNHHDIKSVQETPI